MSSGIEASRLPDLPNAGYSTARERWTSDFVMFFLRGIERDRHFLLDIVCGGIDKWRKSASKIMAVGGGRASSLTNQLLTEMFHYMVLLAGPCPEQQRLKLEQMVQSQRVLRYDFRRRTKDMLERTQAVDRAELQKDVERFQTRRIILV